MKIPSKIFNSKGCLPYWKIARNHNCSLRFFISPNHSSPSSKRGATKIKTEIGAERNKR